MEQRYSPEPVQYGVDHQRFYGRSNFDRDTNSAKLRVENLHYDLTEDDLEVSCDP